MKAEDKAADRESFLRKLGLSETDIAEIGDASVVIKPYGEAAKAKVPPQCKAFKPLDGAKWYPLADKDCPEFKSLPEGTDYCKEWTSDKDSEELELMAADHNNAGVFCAWKMGDDWRGRAAKCFEKALKSRPTPQQKPIIEKNLKNTQGQLDVTWQKTFLPTTYNKLSPEEKAKLMAGDIDGLHFEP